ncbi:hypothetical protein L0128_10805 [candidate division KSB1 bacterium]|nr:hypothetical protein [candidate division KSB1 bacterium]
MSMLNLKRFSELIAKLERLADGVGLHQKEANFPAVLSETEFRQGKTELEDKRQQYDELINRARQAYDSYYAAYEKWSMIVRNSNTMIYGLYGKKNQVVADFGLAPHRPTHPHKTSKSNA